MNRVKPFLPDIISEEQSAFVPGRQNTDNVLVAFEHMHTLAKTIVGYEGFMAIKLDMSKAYDRVEWDFLRWIMQEMGFDQKWITLVMRCISGISYSLLINGRQCGFFRPSRGLRQGDPLSPYLFLLCSEGLSSLLRQSVDHSTLTGLKIAPNALTICHLFFADDTLLFTRATQNDCQRILQILLAYELASGQKINLQKTEISFSPNTLQSDRDYITQSFHLQGGTGHHKYLGLPSLIGRNKNEAFQIINAKVWKRLEGWNGKLLS